MKFRIGLLACLVFLSRPAHSQNPKPLEKDSALAQIAFVHGGTGPFAVAGYRMGERALKELKLPRGTFDLEVVHMTPNEVQYSCIADGAQAATGVSVGKLNLKLVKAQAKDVETIIRDKKSGQTVIFRLNPEFLQRYLNLSHDKLADAGKKVLTLPDEQIFSVQVVPRP
jgi:formylmethanofuran dehydrogenase subunit E